MEGWVSWQQSSVKAYLALAPVALELDEALALGVGRAHLRAVLRLARGVDLVVGPDHALVPPQQLLPHKKRRPQQTHTQQQA